MARSSSAVCSLTLLLVGCSAAGYSPYPLDLGHDLPSDAFQRCRDVLLHRFYALTRSEASTFHLQTDWAPSQDPPGERRATVYVDPEFAQSLAVVVELRRLSLPMIGWPGWTAPRGDAAAERELASALREALSDPAPVGFMP